MAEEMPAPRSVVTQPPLLSSLHGEVVERVLGEMGGTRSVLGFDPRPWTERLARESIDLLAESIGPGAVAHMTEHAEFFRRYIGDGVLHLVVNMVRARHEAPKAGGP
jgi:hypothetical protein